MAPQPTAAPDVQVPEGWANVLFDKAVSLREEYDRNIKARRANREALRSLAIQGLLSDDEIEMLNDLYPERDITVRSPEERAEKLRKEAAEIEAAAKKKG